jgi:trk/ktr system potassium uptake protein
MYAVIMGAGRVGLNLASFLVADGHDVTLIESDDVICADAAAELDALVLCGNGTDTKVLEEARVKDADVFVAATGHDEMNLLACILVKAFKISKIIARVSNPEHEDAFIKVGIDAVINPELTAATYLEKLIIRPKIADLVVLGKGDAELLDLAVKSKEIIGKRIRDISPTDDYIICAIYKDGEINIPHDDTVLKEGDKISILVKINAVRNVVKMFIK